MDTILIGIDDTDNPGTRGTGHLARDLGNECARRGLLPLGVTRHQFLVDPRIPYTSHNSGACVAVESTDGIAALEFAFEFVAERAASDADPGVCVARAASVAAEIVAFGRAAAERVLTIEGALQLARTTKVDLRALGCPGQGVIGALGSIGQRAAGEEGRFIDLPGLRALHGRVDRAAFASVGISLHHESSGHGPEPDDRYETLDWVRPRLVHGRPVLPVAWSDRGHVWLPVDRKHGSPAE